MAKIVDEPKILPETETTEADIRRDVHVTAPNVFAGAHTLPE
jgi:hypothetical protein